MTTDFHYTYIYPLDSVPDEKLTSVGGKAASLARMMKAKKIRVPHGYVIDASAFEAGSISNKALREIEDLVSSLDDKSTYAVRSSALNEDGESASFAGQYETETDVPKSSVFEAISRVVSSAQNARVKEYTESFHETDRGIAVVVQQFVKPLFAGVVFTSDIMTGKDDFMIGNYVEGEGEKLVSGSENAKVFRIGAFKNDYEGDPEMAPYAKALGRDCSRIRDLYRMPMDIEWAVADRKVYILQARPITTLQRLDMRTYDINGTRSGYKLLTKTNVGEIFLKPVSPMTFSVLEKINEMLGIPDWLDNICGQPYMNISVLCSAFVAFGKSKEKAFESIRDLVGTVPDDLDIPVSPFSKRELLKKIRSLIFPKNKSKLSKKEKHKMVEALPELSRSLMKEIRRIDNNADLLNYWEHVLIPKLNDGLASILAECGTAMVPLFSTRKNLTKLAGQDMANRLLGGCVGTLDSMKPLLLIEDIIAGKLSKEEYLNICGHRSVSEMELMAPRPYEDPSFPDSIIEEHRASKVDLHALQDAQKKAFEEALSEFKSKYPNKRKWIDKKISIFAHANAFREDIRSRGVWLFSVFREFLLCAGKVNGLGDDIFMLTVSEMLDLLKGNTSFLPQIQSRKKTYEKYLSYPSFPTLIAGRFDPEKWIADPNRRSDIFRDDVSETDGTMPSDPNAVVKGFPGAAGRVEGVVRVVTDIDHLDEIRQGDILVTVATNVGWTLVFPKVSAIVTDIGAPLSHAAIVAREFGIPAVVGCCNATTLLKTGDRVIVDGAKGTVMRVETSGIE